MPGKGTQDDAHVAILGIGRHILDYRAQVWKTKQAARE
jgi:hypothetical protein